MTTRSTAVLPSGTPVAVTRPEAPPHRGLVLVPDIMGLRPLFDDMAARLAEQHGWAVAAFGLFLSEWVPYVLPLLEAARRIRGQGGVVCAPHPFDLPRSTGSSRRPHASSHAPSPTDAQ